MKMEVLGSTPLHDLFQILGSSSSQKQFGMTECQGVTSRPPLRKTHYGRFDISRDTVS